MYLTLGGETYGKSCSLNQQSSCGNNSAKSPLLHVLSPSVCVCVCLCVFMHLLLRPPLCYFYIFSTLLVLLIALYKIACYSSNAITCDAYLKTSLSVLSFSPSLVLHPPLFLQRLQVTQSSGY